MISLSKKKKKKKKWKYQKMGKHYNLKVKYTNPLDLVTISMLVIFVSTPETHNSLFYAIIFIYFGILYNIILNNLLKKYMWSKYPFTF